MKQEGEGEREGEVGRRSKEGGRKREKQGGRKRKGKEGGWDRNKRKK